MRALVVTLCLAMIVAFLVGILVLFGGVRVSPTLLTTIGGGLFMLAVLFAALSAIGPKFRPTPALTPIMAGTAAASIAASLVLAAHLHSTGQAASFRMSAPQAAAPVPEARSVEPEPTEPPPEAFVALPEAEEQPAGDLPLDDVPMDEPPAEALSETASLPSEPLPMTTPSATTPAPVPIPVPRPRSPSETPQKLLPGETFGLSDQPFGSSPSGASAPRAAPPPSTARIIPPLPRSRPCGAGGPPCP